MTRIRTCPICYNLFEWSKQNRSYCSEECKTEAKIRTERQRHERAKQKEHLKSSFKNITTGKLDEALENAAKQGLSYAEYQKQKTINMIRKGEL